MGRFSWSERNAGASSADRSSKALGEWNYLDDDCELRYGSVVEGKAGIRNVDHVCHTNLVH